MANTTEQLAAERILERGVRVKIPAPFFFRFIGKKTVNLVIRPPYLGTLMHLSRLVNRAGFDLDEINSGNTEAAYRMMEQHTPTLCRIVAVMALNSRVKIALFEGMLAKWLRWHLKPRKLAEVAMTIILLCGVQDFTTTIRLIKSLSMTAPKNLSPKEKGSQEEGQPDSIAPGE